MPNHTLRIAARTVLALAVATSLHAQAQSGNYSPSEAATIRRVAPAKPAAGASYDAGDFPTFRPPLAQGEGSREVNTYCNICHSPRYITMQPVLPASAWSDEVNKMIKTYGAIVPEDAAQKIISYLQSHYTPETRKH
jgi:hypothetical protein